MAAKLLAAHRPFPGTCSSRSVSGACGIERCSPRPVPFPPQPPQKVSLPCSAGSQVLRHSPTSPARACPPFGLWPSRTGLDPTDQGVLEISRFSCMLFYQRARVLRLRRTGQPLAYNAAAVLPSSNSEESRHPVLPAFRSSIARPTNAPVYASSDTSRCHPQDSRSGWIRYFLSCRGLALPYNMPVYPGALREAGVPEQREACDNNSVPRPLGHKRSFMTRAIPCPIYRLDGRATGEAAFLLVQ